MKNFIKILTLIISIIMIFGLVSCSNNKSKESITVGCVKGPTGVGMTKLMRDNDEGNTQNQYSFSVATSPDEISGKLLSGEINIASIPTNVAAKLYAKSEGKITLLAANTLGVLSIIENNENINSILDLKGKTIYSTGEGSNPEYILRYVLKENNIDPDKDVKIEFVTTNDELVAYIMSGKATIAMVPEPAATTVLMKNENIKRAIRINDEWDKICDNGLIMGCVVALDSYVESHKEEINMFLKEYESSIYYVKENISKASELCAKYEITASANIAEKAIDECNIIYMNAQQTKENIKSYFEILFDYDKTSIGGKIPQDDFYYNED